MSDDKPDNIGGTIVPEEMPPSRGMTYTMRVEPPQAVAQGSNVEMYLTVSSSAPPDVQTAIMSAQPAFQNLPEPVLYACAHDDQAVGPRIGVKDVPETTLKALSVYEWERRSRKRERIWWIVGIVLTAFATWFFT